MQEQDPHLNFCIFQTATYALICTCIEMLHDLMAHHFAYLKTSLT